MTAAAPGGPTPAWPRDEKPTAAFVLSLVAGILAILGGIASAALGALFGALIGFISPGLGGIVALVGFLGLIFGVIIIVGATMINSGVSGKIRTGCVLVILFSIFAVVEGWLGIVVLILGLIGGILGLTWRPSSHST